LTTKIKFLGAAKTVTGSKHLLTHRGKEVLIDCGMFQGVKKWRLVNWEPFPEDINLITDIVITHAHIDHTGYLPRLYKYGFEGNIYSTPTTKDLSNIMLVDSAHIQEEDAKFANKKKFSKHSPALPLYTIDDALGVLEMYQPVEYGIEKEINNNIKFKYFDAGHIIGSAFAKFTLKRENGEKLKILFSGDLGRYGEHILKDPEPGDGVDFLICESTYGNRLHKHENVEEKMAEIINSTYQRGGRVIIPAFAVGRTQEVLYHIGQLQKKNLIPLDMKVYMDSPLAIKATRISCNHKGNLNLEVQENGFGKCPIYCKNLHIASTVDESKAINSIREPIILISASGMCEAGRVLHHLKLALPKKENTILFVGYQAEGTRGRRILNGERTIKIHGEHIPINARIEEIDTFSAHADYNEILKWLRTFSKPPKMTFLVHGDPDAIESLSQKIEENLGWKTYIPDYKEEIILDEFI